MTEEVMKVLIAGALLVHGLGHGGALGALVWIWRRPGTDTGDWRAARSWFLPSRDQQPRWWRAHSGSWR